MSLKRLLNPTDPDVFNEAHPHHRSQRGWDNSGNPIEDTPVLQEWGDHFGGIFGSNDFTHITDENGFNQGRYCFAQEQIEQWAAENVPSQTTSATPRSSDENEEICYGMIYRTQVKLRGQMIDLDSKLGTIVDEPHGMRVQKSDERPIQYLVTFNDGFVMGQLNAQLEKALQAIVEKYRVELEVLAAIKTIRETIEKTTKEKDAIVRVNINMYGARTVALQVGRELSKHKIYLQRPDQIRNGFIYDNPHVLKLPEFDVSHKEFKIRAVEEKQLETNKAEAFKKVIADVYSSLTRGQKLVGLEGDGRLKTPLLLHQKKALDFMTQRESGPIADEYCLWKPYVKEGQACYRHTVTNIISRFPQTETGGGILADEMGMGKTLCVLALILRSLEIAYVWSLEDTKDTHGPTPELKVKRRTRATLVVASSDFMINEWIQEIERHFHYQINGSLKTIKYHGQNRETDIANLCDTDLVITTYHTLASDFGKKRNPLNKILWYRIVLDEAHIIRRQSTGLHRTVARLEAKSRWCLTGTPIQNRLEDIGSLFAFLQIKPLQNPSEFRKSIAIPFEEGGTRRKAAIGRFTLLLDAMCLRRTKELLCLPGQRDIVRMIGFSDDERRQYDQTSKMMLRPVRNQVGAFDRKGMLGMFQAQLQLRILCNHGTYQQPFSWNLRKLHLLDEREDMENSLGRDGEITCSNCKETMPLFGNGSMFKRCTKNCRHVLCSECIEESTTSSQDTISEDYPLCSSLWGSVSTIPSQSQRSTQSEDVDNYFRPEGRSSKVEALMVDVLQDLFTTKSIIFSCWTRTLDLIEASLRYAQVSYQRIDGECPTAEREKILDDFARVPHLRVLIMTTGTGAVELNLATANRVFIVEPQWNPSVENQAIARVLRLGQKQSVQVTRYVVNGTVEQDMRTLQDRKLEIAGIA